MRSTLLGAISSTLRVLQAKLITCNTSCSCCKIRGFMKPCLLREQKAAATLSCTPSRVEMSRWCKYVSTSLVLIRMSRMLSEGTPWAMPCNTETLVQAASRQSISSSRPPWTTHHLKESSHPISKLMQRSQKITPERLTKGSLQAREMPICNDQLYHCAGSIRKINLESVQVFSRENLFSLYIC